MKSVDFIDEAVALLTVTVSEFASPHSLDDDNARHGLTLIVQEVIERLNRAAKLMNAPAEYVGEVDF